MEEIVELVAARWPGAACDPAREVPGLDGEHRDDVVLAWAAHGGIEPAIAELEKTIIGPALAHVRARRLGDALDDLGQLLRMRLLVEHGLASYRGRGSLAAFVRTTAIRLALDQRRVTREIPTNDLDSLVDHVTTDPELDHMRERYAGELGAALRAAWAALAPHDRFVLELELHQRVGIEQIARIYGVHRTNATRRVASARGAFVIAVRTALRDKLGVADPTLDSILRLMTTSARWSALEAIS